MLEALSAQPDSLAFIVVGGALCVCTIGRVCVCMHVFVCVFGSIWECMWGIDGSVLLFYVTWQNSSWKCSTSEGILQIIH